MVGLIVVTIALSGWAMTKFLGYTMFFFYVSKRPTPPCTSTISTISTITVSPTRHQDRRRH